MKKLLALFALALFVNLSVTQAQTANTTSDDVQKKEVVATDAAKQCKGVTSSCTKPCGSNKAAATETSTTTLSENYVNAGSASPADVKAVKASCSPEQAKSCCSKGGAKASAMSKDLKQANTSNAISTKEAETPKQ